jgi:hypothetical protein
MASDVERPAEQVVQAMNAAEDGRIIADTEELVREAMLLAQSERCRGFGGGGPKSCRDVRSL